MKTDGMPLPHPTAESLRAAYEASPGHRFDLALEGSGFCSLASEDYWCIHSRDTFFGYFVLDRVRVAPLTQEDSVLHTRHLRCISTTQDLRGIGLWSTVLAKMIELADRYGVFLHAISYPFQMQMPSIANSEDFLQFIQNEDLYFKPLMSWARQKKASKDLLKKYLEVGFCRFRYPSGNGFHRRWTRDNLGFAYLPQSLKAAIHAKLRPSVWCAQ
jgi:hypothetical protein